MSDFSAVLVGINAYPGAPLKGCVNDVVIMRDILVHKYNVPASSIRLLLDDRATKEGILERLNWLATNPSKNKMFHYSGHGAQFPNQPYDKDDYEPDGMDEILCPIDMDWDGTFILDDQIDEALEKMIDGHHMTMVFDCCHSGTIDRDFAMSNDLELQARRMDTPLDLMSRLSGLDLSGDIVNAEKTTEGFGSDEDFDKFFWFKPKPTTTNKRKANRSNHNVSILTGCKDNQTSADSWVGNRYQGALTFMMQHFLMQEPNISLKRLRSKVSRSLSRYGFSQSPQLSCSEENYDRPFIQV